MKNSAKKSKKIDGKKLMSMILAGLMVLGAASTAIYMIAASIG